MVAIAADPLFEISLPELAARSPVAGVRIIDVRSPAEFDRDHIPGARSVPLFSDAERSVIGTLYRHVGPDPARAWGTRQVRQRLADFTRRLLAALELPACPSAADPGEPLRVVVCARGGQRSEAVTRLLRSLGHPVLRLTGGYRAHRLRVRAALAQLDPPRPVVLNGLTGSGKTLVLRAIARRYPGRVVDLEGLAGHRSSVLGAVGLEPVSQRRFESRLSAALDRLDGPWSLFEWEARRLGNREIPARLYEVLRAAPHLELEADLERRLDILCEEYVTRGCRDGVRERLPALARYDGIGEEGVVRLQAWLDADRPRDVARALLAEHYDPRYRHGHRDIPVVARIPVTEIEATASTVIRWIEEHA